MYLWKLPPQTHCIFMCLWYIWPYVCLSAPVRAHMYGCVYVCMSRGHCLTLGVFLLLIYCSSLNPELTSVATWPTQFAPGMSCLYLLCAGMHVRPPHLPACMWVLGVLSCIPYASAASAFTSALKTSCIYFSLVLNILFSSLALSPPLYLMTCLLSIENQMPRVLTPIQSCSMGSPHPLYSKQLIPSSPPQ